MTTSETPTIIAINGSERANGNTSFVLGQVSEVVARRGARLEQIDLATQRFAACGACGDCNVRKQLCKLDDDMPPMLERMLRADGLIYASPVHGFGTASQMQRFIERAGVCYLRHDRRLTNKVAGAIVVGRRYSHSEVHSQLLNNLLLNRMLLVGSGFPAVVHAGDRAEVMADREGLDSVERLVQRMLDMIDLLRAHRRLTGKELPVPPPPGLVQS